jgi:hypothetical protein
MNSPSRPLRTGSESSAGLKALSNSSLISLKSFLHPDRTGNKDDKVGNKNKLFATHKVIVGQCALYK